MAVTVVSESKDDEPLHVSVDCCILCGTRRMNGNGDAWKIIPLLGKRGLWVTCR